MHQTSAPPCIGEAAPAPARRARLMHEKPIPLRLPADELSETLALAAGEDRSASNFVLVVHRLGVAEFKRQRGLK